LVLWTANSKKNKNRTVENFNRGYKFDAILGGAEEVLGDLGVRQAMKFMPHEKL
jgi:hypothetical protein